MTDLRVDVRHQLASLADRIALLPEERLLAGVRAANRTMTTVRAQASRALRPEYPGIKAAQIKARMPLKRATRSEPIAAITFSGKRFTLYGGFGMRALGKWGVRFSKLPWRIETVSGEEVSPQMLQRAFRNRGTGGRAQVFSRHTKVRTSHEVLVAPGLARAIVERHHGEALRNFARSRFMVVFFQEAKYRLSKR